MIVLGELLDGKSHAVETSPATIKTMALRWVIRVVAQVGIPPARIFFGTWLLLA